MGTFANFINLLKNEANDGKNFEKFCVWFLTNDDYWKTQVEKVWLWNEWPDRWGPDCGIDLIFKHKNGGIWAVQAKCYDESTTITKADMDSFLSESNRKKISHRLLLASTNSLSRNAIRACQGQEKPITLFLRNDFTSAHVNYPEKLTDTQKPEKRKKPVPDPHQKTAINDVIKGFQTSNRGQLVMACGTSKTFTTLWIDEALCTESTLVLVPSLNLLSQILSDWLFASERPFSVLCVCSDASVTQKSNEDLLLSEAPFAVTSDLDEISKFLSSKGKKIVFCTYHASPLISQAQRRVKNTKFELTVADEAHRCAGKSEAAFSTILDGSQIKSDKRLFCTATPRLFTKSLTLKAKEQGTEIYGMDDQNKFGPVFHSLRFGEAITKNLLSDYRLIIVGVDEPIIRDWIETKKLLAMDPEKTTDAKTLAAQVGLFKAIKDFDLKRVISFHNTVSAARSFASDADEIKNVIETEKRPGGRLWTSCVSGDMRTFERINQISKLKELDGFERGLLTNARCLSEGVDVPALDGIAFIEPKHSQVDIVQAVGRAIRKERNATSSKIGTIVIPVFIEHGDDYEAKIESSEFNPVWAVVKALRSHDEVLAQRLNNFRTNLGVGKSQTGHIDHRIIFDLPANVGPEFSKKLSAVLVESTTAMWDYWFGVLLAFKEQFGHTAVPLDYLTKSKEKLGV